MQGQEEGPQYSLPVLSSQLISLPGNNRYRAAVTHNSEKPPVPHKQGRTRRTVKQCRRIMPAHVSRKGVRFLRSGKVLLPLPKLLRAAAGQAGLPAPHRELWDNRTLWPPERNERSTLRYCGQAKYENLCTRHVWNTVHGSSNAKPAGAYNRQTSTHRKGGMHVCCCHK